MPPILSIVILSEVFIGKVIISIVIVFSQVSRPFELRVLSEIIFITKQYL